MVAARHAALGDPPCPTLRALEAYADATHSSLLYLLLEALSFRSTALDHAASHIGKAAGIAALLRALPLLASRGSVPLPLDLCAQYNLCQQDVLARRPSPALQDVVYHLALQANSHLLLATAAAQFPPAAISVLLAAVVPPKIYLERLQRANFHPFDPGLQNRDWNLPYRLCKAYITKSI
ncbi:NADH dehydrogenase (ubiquinone) complex I, assembly factor 6 [Neolecta irregularis DAH-3]|uniref:NADH dehydrogenase (Ubiquinone) complex I, assembly factor 6 n=1 Tax=Neolecta irregularis (strain DAH-3) TaxID=1198029 RepID=A0A1U7LM55_NEOID|nr:NADH dehydrogenase (ubiquinone) complex I, assembly factor 6 [Neolecta irregularis DAH-3]|eukprot:OLL23746.1 NADH dehydrogenase (ubiquinone) complex I, assembly factor 6 [Neolecta irregularis DAH-3]